MAKKKEKKEKKAGKRMSKKQLAALDAINLPLSGKVASRSDDGEGCLPH